MKVQSFGLICVVVNIVRIKKMTPVVVTIDKNNGSERSMTRQERDRDDIMQRIRLLRITILVDTLAHHQ